jgi:hypothetical protein
VSEDNRRRTGQRVVILDEAFRFGGVVRREVVGPAKADGLIPQLDFDMEWALRSSEVDGILHAITGIGEIGIVRGIAVRTLLT